MSSFLARPHSDNRVWTEFTSGKFERGRCEWVLTGQFAHSGTSVYLRNTVLRCVPIDAKKTSIWSGAKLNGDVVMCKSDYDDQVVVGTWSHAYDFRNMNGTISEIDPSELIDDCWAFEDAEKPLFKVRIQFGNVFCDIGRFFRDCTVKLQLVDLADPNNAMIESPDDAAPVDVDGERLWLSKSQLSTKSPFFNALFNSDFKEKRSGKYELKEIELDVFLHFVSLIYGLEVSINGETVEPLLKMADYFQCCDVTKRCENSLIDEKEVRFERKIILADRYKLFKLMHRMVWEMAWDHQEEMMKCVNKRNEYNLCEATVKFLNDQMLDYEDAR